MLDPDVDFILANADRLITVAARCTISSGLSDGLNALLLDHPKNNHDDWHQAVAGLQRDALLMAALRTALLLDRDETMVSLQAVYHRLNEPRTVGWASASVRGSPRI